MGDPTFPIYIYDIINQGHCEYWDCTRVESEITRTTVFVTLENNTPISAEIEYRGCALFTEEEYKKSQETDQVIYGKGNFHVAIGFVNRLIADDGVY